MTRPLRRARGAEAAVLALRPDRAATEPLHAQFARGIRSMILNGRMAPRARLPSTWALASELGISRATAVLALEGLVAEGYVAGRRGSGIFVTPTLPDEVLPTRTARPSACRTSVAPCVQSEPWRPLDLRVVHPGLFPHRDWARLLARSWRGPEPGLLDWARTVEGWVAEDDFDGEYRFAGPSPRSPAAAAALRVASFVLPVCGVQAIAAVS